MRALKLLCELIDTIEAKIFTKKVAGHSLKELLGKEMPAEKERGGASTEGLGLKKQIPSIGFSGAASKDNLIKQGLQQAEGIVNKEINSKIN